MRLPELFRVKMMTLPVWLKRGAPATSRRPFLADTTDVTVYPDQIKEYTFILTDNSHLTLGKLIE